jgi:hypothetical protein
MPARSHRRWNVCQLEGAVQHAHERRDASRIELGPDPGLELGQDIVQIERRAVGPLAGHGVERIGHGHDAGGQRDLLTPQSVREPAAVEPLVVPPHDGEHRGTVV